MYNAYITRIKNVRPHPNADRLDLVDCFGNTVCVSRDSFAEGGLAVYFPTDGQLSEEFCQVHNLVRKKDDAGNNIGGYMDPDKRNVKAIRLRGERSDGLAMPLECLAYTGVDLTTLEEGFCFTTINGKEICCKYIPRSNRRAAAGSGNRTRKHRVPVAPLFAEHADTEQLAYNLSAFRPGDEIEITLKMHGTSGRTARLPFSKAIAAHSLIASSADRALPSMKMAMSLELVVWFLRTMKGASMEAIASVNSTLKSSKANL